MPETKSRTPTKRRLFIFRIIAITSPFILLAVIEILLRLFHYGNNLDLFIESPANADYYIFNPAASKRYFTNQAIATTGNREPFRKEKEDNTLRIFILGESTTVGYPYFHNGSFHRWLLYRLMNSFPDKKFEFINCSLTAVNTYTVLGFAKEVVHYQPDAVLIYTGHNEYYGVMGVGSTDNMGNNRFVIGLVLWLRQFRFVQMLTNFYTFIQHLFHSGNDKGGTRMEMMVNDQKIDFGTDTYKKGLAQFALNMDQALKILNQYQVPVFLSTLVSNEKDLKPFVNIEADSIRYPDFKKLFLSGLEAYHKNDLSEASRILRSANNIYPDYALSYFTLGSIAYQQKNFDSAKILFAKASDLDGLRFRAPSAINDIIRQLVSKYDNTHLVDTRAVFEAQSPNHIIGNELLLEHVHPNLDGYALMSEAFLESMKKNHLIQLDSGQELPFAQMKKQMPISRVDSLAALYRIGNLKRSWPFSESMITDSMTVVSTEEKIAYALANKKIEWYEAMDTLYNYYIGTGQFNAAKTVVEGLVLEYPDDPVFASKTGNLYGKLGDYDKAVFYLKRAFDISPSPEQAKTIFVLCLKMDKPSAAMPFINYTVENSGDQRMQALKTLTSQIIELEKRDSTQIQSSNEVARLYLQMGNKEAAGKYNQRALRINATDGEALGMKRSLAN